MVKKEKALIKADESKISTDFGGVTGSTYKKLQTSYPYLNILQSDKQVEKFSDFEDITMKDYGKLYIRSQNGNSSKDLLDKISGTIIGEQSGSELWDETGIVYGSKEFVNQDIKDKFISERGSAPDNVVKLLLKLDKEIKLDNGEKYGYVMITIKRSGWGNYTKLIEQEKNLVLNSKEINAPLDAIPVCFFNITIITEKTEDKKLKRSWYNMKFDVKMNSYKESVEFSEDVKSASQVDFIRVGSGNTANTRKVPDKSYEDESLTKSEIVGDNDNPFNEGEIVDEKDKL